MTTHPTPRTADLAAHVTQPLPAHIPAPLRDCFNAQRAAFQNARNPDLQERRNDLRVSCLYQQGTGAGPGRLP